MPSMRRGRRERVKGSRVWPTPSYLQPQLFVRSSVCFNIEKVLFSVFGSTHKALDGLFNFFHWGFLYLSVSTLPLPRWEWVSKFCSRFLRAFAVFPRAAQHTYNATVYTSNMHIYMYVCIVSIVQVATTKGQWTIDKLALLRLSSWLHKWHLKSFIL